MAPLDQPQTSLVFETDDQLAARLRAVETKLRGLELVALAVEVGEVALILAGAVGGTRT